MVPIVAGLCLLSLPGLSRRQAKGVDPVQWTGWCALAVATGALAFELGLLFFAVPTLLRARGLVGLASACVSVFRHDAPGGPVAGWIAGALALMVGVGGAVSWRRVKQTRRIQHVEPWIGAHEPCDGGELVVLPDASPTAWCVDGEPDQIVITTGLVEGLAGPELNAVIRHEAAHLAGRHHRLLTLAAVSTSAFWWFPPAGASAAALRLAMERAADEAAGDTPARRRAVSDALHRLVALAVTPGTAAFSSAECVSERLEALGASPQSLDAHVGLFIGGAGWALGAMAVTGLLMWLMPVHSLVVLAGQCPLT
ncbi:MAG: M56 family metallopeptidase [Acidimicrobiales bacterium]